MKNVLAGIALAAATSTGLAAPVKTCDREHAASVIAALGDVYIGETHGTSEIPALLLSVVTQVTNETSEPVLVSLELPPSASVLNSSFWSGTDGRSSRAMASLVKALLEMESEKKISIHYQYGEPGITQQNFDASVGSRLSELASKNRLIAYGGNFHSRKKPVEGIPGQSAGMIMDGKITAVTLLPTSASSAWVCLGQDKCGVHDFPGMEAPAGACSADGAEVGHDIVVYLDALTASPPARRVDEKSVTSP